MYRCESKTECKSKQKTVVGVVRIIIYQKCILILSHLSRLLLYIKNKMSEGYVKLHRKLQDNPLWYSEKFTKGQAWVDLILLANHKYGFFFVRGNKIEVQRGQVGWSVIKLAARWKWSRSKVNNYLKHLKKEQQIDLEKSKVYTIITILNYEEYQKKEQQTVQQKSNRRATEEQQKDTNNNVKKEKNNITTTKKTSSSNKKSQAILVREQILEIMKLLNASYVYPKQYQVSALMKQHGFEKLCEIISNAKWYWSQRNGKDRFRIRPNKFFEKYSTFSTRETTQDRLNEETEWERREKAKEPPEIVKYSKSNCTLVEFYKAGVRHGVFNYIRDENEKYVTDRYEKGFVIKLEER